MDIRTKYPGYYDDLSDEKLVGLWLIKYPNDINKIIMNKPLVNNSEDTKVEITNYFLKWIGIIICTLSVVSFFISSEWALNFLIENKIEFGQNDSDVNRLFANLSANIVVFALWLKKLPIIIKIIGIISGGVLWLIYNDYDLIVWHNNIPKNNLQIKSETSIQMSMMTSRIMN
jgi:hypothetical protein